MERGRWGRIITAGLTLGGLMLPGCDGGAPEPQTPFEATRAAIETQITKSEWERRCLALEPNIDACARRVEFSSVEPRIDKLLSIMATSNISEESKEAITEVLSTISIMQKEGRIRWYIYKQPRPIGAIQTGRDRWVLPFIGEDFFVYLVLPQDQPLIQSEVLGTSFHEMLHGARAYKRFKIEEVDPAFDVAPDQEEYEAEYYEFLIAKAARLAGFRREESEVVLAHFGIDLAEVVHFLDQKNIGPESKIYHYLSDWQERYLLQRQCQEMEKALADNPSDSKLGKELEDARGSIEEIEEKWEGFPPQEFYASEVIQQIKARPDWVSPLFFVISP